MHPLPYTACVTDNAGCGQHTSIDLHQGVILQLSCQGTSCCSAQPGATQASGEPLRQRNCIARDTAHGATDPASSPRGVLPQGQQTPSSRTLSARGVSAISAGVPRFDCSTRLWLQDWSCINQGGGQYWLQGSRASLCCHTAQTEQDKSPAPWMDGCGDSVGLLLAGRSARARHNESLGSCQLARQSQLNQLGTRGSMPTCSTTSLLLVGDLSLPALHCVSIAGVRCGIDTGQGVHAGYGDSSKIIIKRELCTLLTRSAQSSARGLMQTCSTASFLPVGDLHAQLALGQLADGVGAQANVADSSKSKFKLRRGCRRRSYSISDEFLRGLNVLG